VLLQRRQRAVVAERDRPDRPGDDGEVDGQDSPPPPRRPPAEDEHGQIGEVEGDEEVGQGGIDAGHSADGTASTARPLRRNSAEFKATSA
jgi:hypothetical protein